MTFLLCVACASRNTGEPLSHVQLIDRNGVNETISHKERLDTLSQVNFLQSQPYQKVVRVFKRDGDGKILSKLTTYHPNGEIYQYLEVKGGRAKGIYKEWHDNGQLKIEVTVMEGVGDLTPDAQTTWVFDGMSKVWDREGHVAAEFFYQKGKMEGEALYYYPNGRLSKTIPYKADKINGEKRVYSEEGDCVGKVHYSEGVKEGRSYFISPKQDEIYQRGLLMTGNYWDLDGNKVHGIREGNGFKPIFEEGALKVEQEYRGGRPEGLVKVYRRNGSLEKVYQTMDGQKEGDETFYYENGQPKLQIHWHEDEICGQVRSWYANGKHESEKEMVGNKKQGQYIAWYEDGSLMMYEEYENDLLTNGKYLKRGEEIPSSRVIQGNGTVTLYDANGGFLRKVEYRKGMPFE